MAKTPEQQIEQSLSALFKLAAQLPEKDGRRLLRQAKKIGVAFGSLAKNNQTLQEENQTLQKYACIDLLTGIPNRRGIGMDFHGRLEHMKRHKDSDLVLCLIDLDGFKAVNDRCGHDKGDDALREVSGRLQNAFRQSDTIGRYGGDEIVLFLSYDHQHTEKFEPDSVRSKVRNALKGLVYWSGQDPFPIGASIGFSRLLSHDVHEDMTAEVKLESMMMEADADMYADKRAGKEQRLSIARQAAHAAGKNGKVAFQAL